MNRYEQIVLENLLKSGYALCQRSFLNTFTSRDRLRVLGAIGSLESKLLVVRDYSVRGIVIALPTNKIKEAMGLVSLIKFDDQSCTSIDELIPKKYAPSFLVANGEKKIHGHVSKYVFCHSRKNSHDVTCFVINHKGNVHSIHLGSVLDPASMISEFLKEIDTQFKSKQFTKENLKTSLPKKLIQNNQPTKAAVEYLCHENFLIRYNLLNDWSKFQRTGKPHPVTPLDEIISLHKSKPTHMSFNGGKYAYHEDDGLYPVLE